MTSHMQTTQVYIWFMFAIFIPNSLSIGLPTPHSVSSRNGFLEITLTIEETLWTSSSGIELNTRTLNGTIPGPTIRLKPGDTLIVNFINKLTGQGNVYSNNEFSGPDESNIHFHGLHVSGELPSDDVSYAVLAGESYRYQTTLPIYHMPGTHWMHPHRHGSTSLQVGGGAALALIVDDDETTLSSLPPQISSAPEIVLVIMQMSLDALSSVASSSGDGVWRHSSSIDEFTLVNGEVEPTMTLTAGEWTRFRIVYAAWLEGDLDLAISGCEMQLLAKDGIYIRDFPRSITKAAVVPGGRADIMVRCKTAATDYSVTKDGDCIATITTNDDAVVESNVLSPWTVNYPPYLEDVRDVAASSGCACVTRAGIFGSSINGRQFEPDFFLHESYVGAVVEREIDFDNHPYHQHVYPYQLISGFDTGDYNKLGDWHDTMSGEGVVRHRNVNISGKVMIHCHRLMHEDHGMMTMEMVNATGSACVCGSVWVFFNVMRSSLVLVLIAVGVALCVNMKKGEWTLRCCCCEKGGDKDDGIVLKDEEDARVGASDNEIEMERAGLKKCKIDLCVSS